MRDMISKKNSKYLYVHTYFSSISPLKAFLGHGCESQLRPVTLTGLVSTELTQQPWIEIRHLEKNMMIPEKRMEGFYCIAQTSILLTTFYLLILWNLTSERIIKLPTTQTTTFLITKTEIFSYLCFFAVVEKKWNRSWILFIYSSFYSIFRSNPLTSRFREPLFWKVEPISANFLWSQWISVLWRQNPW